MNDIDGQFGRGEEEPAKTTLTQRKPEPAPVCTVFSDGAIRVESNTGLSLVELQRLLLASALSITDRTVQRGAAMERVLMLIQSRYDGFDPEVEHSIATVLGQRQG
jgi:hypothetical protein